MYIYIYMCVCMYIYIRIHTSTYICKYTYPPIAKPSKGREVR